jgi:hypothetical protein
MLKHLLISGWFRIQPFLNYVVVVILIAPLVAASSNSTSAQQSQEAAKIATNLAEWNSVKREASSGNKSALEEGLVVSKAAKHTEAEAVSSQVSLVSKTADSQDFLKEHAHSISSVATPQPQLLQDESDSGEQHQTISEKSVSDPLAAVELAPSLNKADSVSKTLLTSQHNLVQRLRTAKVQIQSVTRVDGSASQAVLTEVLPTAKTVPSTRKSQQISATSSAVEHNVEQAPQQDSQQDPIGSAYPIPWQWIQATQEAVSSRGKSEVHYYRSVPVISPDGRYAVYSRVQLVVYPEMYKSRVTSVLFVEDRQTNTLQVVSTTAPIQDPLLRSQAPAESTQDTQGSIAVLVPVSWSKNGDRFLARKFEGMMNTSDLTDHAVIWDRHKNNVNCVTPSQERHPHDIAVLLGWSKTHPDHVLFRAGEMGEENWSLITVASDGTTAITTEADKPVTYGQKIPELWAGPPVASR